jgi:hypothetical protein
LSERRSPPSRGLARARAFGQRDSDIRVDWFRLLNQLKDEGYSLYAVSHFTAIPKSTLIGYKNGSQPSYHQGVCLLQFWSQATGKLLADVPTISQFSFMA